jgi:hypothetical protein
MFELEEARKDLPRASFAQCLACGSISLAEEETGACPRTCAYCGGENLRLEDKGPPFTDDELREELESEFGVVDDSRPHFYDDVQNYLYHHGQLHEAERRCRDKQRALAPVRRCRARARRSHRVVRVAKTSSGDSGDPDPELPGNRRYLPAEVAP